MTGKNSLRHFWRKYRLSLLGVAVILGFIFLSGTFLSAQEQVHGKNPLETENKESSRIAVTGKNYTLNYKQEEEYKREQAKREEKIKQQPAEPIEEIKSETESGKKKTSSILSENSSQAQTGDKNSVGNGDKTEEGQGKPETGGGNEEGNGEGESGENTGGDEEVSKLPEIICSLTEGQVVSGGFLGFTVQATHMCKNQDVLFLCNYE